MTKGIKSRLRDSILKKRGIEPGVGIGLGEQITSVPPPDGIKTLAMRLLEARFGIPIAVLLQSGKLSEVSEFLGVDESTVSKWRLRLKLRSARTID